MWLPGRGQSVSGGFLPSRLKRLLLILIRGQSVGVQVLKISSEGEAAANVHQKGYSGPNTLAYLACWAYVPPLLKPCLAPNCSLEGNFCFNLFYRRSFLASLTLSVVSSPSLPPSLPPPCLPPLPLPSTASVSVVSPAVGLVRKLVGVLEAIEKLPVFVHETGGQVLNLQVTPPIALYCTP